MINETHFNKELNRELSENAPEGLKDENLAVFNEFIACIDGVSIEKSETALIDGQKFIIESQTEPIKAAQGTLGQPSEKDKIATRLKIIIAPDFSMNDVPLLVKQIEKLHNQNEETAEGGMILEAAQFISESYLYWAKQLDGVIDRVPAAIRPRFREYIDKLIELSAAYSQEGVGNRQLKDISDTDFLNVSIWTKTTEGKRAIARWNEFISGPMNEYKDRPEKLEHLMDLVDILVVIPNIKESLDYNLSQTIFSRGEKEMWQLSDAPDVFKQEFDPENIKKYFESTFPVEWSSLDDLRHKLQEAKDRGNEKEVVRLQKKIAEGVMAIVDSGRFWTYKADEYRMSGIPVKREVNCMARGAIIHNVFKEFFNEETLGGQTRSHFFPVLRLADGSFYTIDETVNPRILKNLPNTELHNIGTSRLPRRQYAQKSWLYVGNHDKTYQAGIWGWLMKPNNFRFTSAKALKAAPNHPSVYQKLISVIEESDPFPNRVSNMETAILTILGLVKNDPLYFTVAGNFYAKENLGNNPKKAVEYYQKALDIMDRHPGLENNWSIAEIERRRKKANAKIKRK